MEDDKMYFHLEEDDSIDIVVNSELLLHIKRSDMGYIVDTYKDSENIEKMLDSGYIKSLTVWDDEIDEVEEYDDEEE